jgi:hypothetical protein
VWVVRLLLAGAGLAAAGVAVSGRVTNVLDNAPTTPLVTAMLAAGSSDQIGTWVPQLAALAGVTAAAWVGGIRVATLLQRRPALVQARGESRRWRRRPLATTPLRANLRVDHAGVWRSAPLRRGVVALGVIPGAAAAASDLNWSMIALLPGLVASGAGLLFGVNAFSLDGSGALWRETLPGPPRTLLAARLLVVGEVCVAGALVALAAAALRAHRHCRAGELRLRAGLRPPPERRRPALGGPLHPQPGAVDRRGGAGMSRPARSAFCSSSRRDEPGTASP